MNREAALARTFVELADTLVDDFDVVDVLTLLTSRCVDVLSVGAAGIMLVSPGGDLRVVASSSEATRVLELFELQAEEGPCIDCCHSGEPIVNEDLATQRTRWPRFAAEARDAGFRSVHALPMRLRGTVLGALNLFHTAPHLESADVEVAQALADVATIAILQNQAAREAEIVNEQLQHALASRVVIEQAKGMLGERLGLSIEDAFAVLRRYARSHNLRLADLAGDVVALRVPAAQLDPLRGS